MAEPHVQQRRLLTRDNPDVLRGMNSESAELLCLDPPCNTNRPYEAAIGSEAAGAALQNTWTLSDVDWTWLGWIAEREPALPSSIDAAGRAQGKGRQSELVMRAVRLLEMKRLLKPTGSLYLLYWRGAGERDGRHFLGPSQQFLRALNGSVGQDPNCKRKGTQE